MQTIQIGGQAVPFELHLDVLLLCVGLVAAYVALIRKHGPAVEARGETVVTRRQMTWFGFGVAALWVASGSPLHTLADQFLFSAHMVQHLVQAFVLAPLLVMGTPGWMLEVLTKPAWLRSTIKMLGAPLIAGFAFNVVLLGIHWPVILNAMINSEGFHAFMHLSLVAVSLLMWLPLLSNSDAVVKRMNPLPRLGYLFGMTLLPTVPASFLTFAPVDKPLYPIYGQFPRLWEIPVGEDMLIAGLLMKSGAGFLLWGIIATMFFRWSASEERREQADRAAAATPATVA